MQIPITPYKIQKAWRYLLHFGPKAFFAHLFQRLLPESIPYEEWYEKHRPKEADLNALRRKNRPEDPLVSIIVAAYETEEKYLRELLDSVLAQTYENWELCIADASDRTDKVQTVLARYTDPRIRCRKLAENRSISENMNVACEMARGQFLCFLDHDDLLAPHALRKMIDAAADADMVYSDEDKIRADSGVHFQPHFKPDYNPDLLRSNNYITHFLMLSRDLFAKAGPFRAAYNGAQDYDVILRAAEQAKKIAHVPEILYHWRTHPLSTSDNPESKLYAYESGRRAIEDHLVRCGIEGEVSMLPEYGFYRVRYKSSTEPLVSVIIPNKDEAKTLRRCLAALRETDYPAFEILIVENGSKEEETFALYRELEKRGEARVLTWEQGFNYAAINNFAAREAKGEYLLFLNNDVRMEISRDWLREMASVLGRPDVGAVGAKLYYPNNRIQHAGCVIGIGGIAGAVFTDMPRAMTGYMNRASLLQDLSAVTAACMLMKKRVFDEAGGFTEKLTVAFNDIDLCLKVRENGWLIVYDPYVEGYHDESRTRGDENTESKRRRFQTEIEYMRTRWESLIKEGDPYYNKNLSLTRWDYSIRP